VATIIAGCGAVAPAPSPLLRGQPASYLLSIDQMVSPDFILDTAPHPLGVAEIAAANQSAAHQLTAAGFLGASAEDFFRNVGSLVLADGPVQVKDSVERFASTVGAGDVYRADVNRLDAAPGAVAVSTGSLGDQAHATTTTAVTSDGLTAVEITVEWRVQNLLDILIVRGRQGGTRPDDALILAHRQTIIELGLATPAPRVTTGASPSPT
jgi:hypothetical protein